MSLFPSLPTNEILRKGIRISPSVRSRKEQLGATRAMHTITPAQTLLIKS